MITERQLSEELGVSRQVVRNARRALGLEFAAAKNSTVLAQDEADAVRGYVGCPPVEKAAALGAQAWDQPTLVDDQPAAAGPGPVTYLTVSRKRQVLNEHILMATDGKNEFRVEVRSSKNFTKGMEIPVWHIQGDLYKLARPCPRSKGRW